MSNGTQFKQRDIVLLPFPYTDLSGAKQRPAVIVSNRKLNRTQDRICCLVTSNRPKDGILISKTEEGSLPFQSWVKPHRVFTVDTRVIKKKLCKVSKQLHTTIVAEINTYLKEKN